MMKKFLLLTLFVTNVFASRLYNFNYENNTGYYLGHDGQELAVSPSGGSENYNWNLDPRGNEVFTLSVTDENNMVWYLSSNGNTVYLTQEVGRDNLWVVDQDANSSWIRHLDTEENGYLSLDEEVTLGPKSSTTNWLVFL